MTIRQHLPTDQRDLLLLLDCASPPPELTGAQADFLALVHAGHGAGCLQLLAATALRFAASTNESSSSAAQPGARITEASDTSGNMRYAPADRIAASPTASSR
ncbi:hypothetical protein [Nocardia suismassiliense]|uniref:hypothetical protein n=1 Tax=Nocardia suismassiliense TaxID=2077092 RepID=UPI00131F4069|nr:hypothetical protein [Nocardia suismassiliense]